MKQISLILLSVLILSNPLFAQHKPFKFGFKAAGNIGWLGSINEDYKNEEVNLGGAWGFVADFFIMENYSFTTGFDVLYLNGTIQYPYLYSNQENFNTEVGTLERNYRTKYVKIPLIFTMETNPIKKIRYYGQIGFGFSILLTAKADDLFMGNTENTVISEDKNIYSEVYPTRESLILGAGIEVPLVKSMVARFGLLFDNAFINILKGNNTVDSSIKHNARNNFIELNATVLF
ncbi:MAG: PorT family protein [Lentimicrobiaceae bacterium]|jgi:hypothetical protein|nr:PorT family protein [Lentimicrobiaceae bacterium]MCP4910724.1 PorT family protein [Bacteroidota bacterium]MBT3454681.1 PorT family protein [Lentimicrobiaceae bacterium]MBT3819715.1 PorT family protein [Lentimicrobiaceae bacterium]MBT4061207.1 PorT family protein [Lentimicrobiaceae bacterium]